MTPNDAAISVRDLSVRFGNRQPLRSVSVTVPRGAVVGIVGRNGAGKTTLLQTMLGLVHPESGVATILGDPARALTDATKSRLGYVAQSPELFEWLRARDQLELYEALYPTWSRSYANTLMKRFELNPKARTRQLSIGERQRLAIVLALSHRPDLVILDEPVASLDPMSRRDFLRSLFDDDGGDSKSKTILLSSHLLEDLERVVTHVLFMREGNVQLFASVEDIEAHVRGVELSAPLPETQTNASALHQARLKDGTVQAVIDLRDPRGAALASNGAARSLSIVELFLALNQ